MDGERDGADDGEERDEGGDPACWAEEFRDHLGLDDPDDAGPQG